MRCLVIGVMLIVLLEAKSQTVKVKGTVICDKKRLPGVTVELWERDTLDPNDKMATAVTDKEGTFELVGTENEVTGIEPYIQFKHTCHGCVRTTEYEIPKKFINSEDTYDMTYVNMDIHSKVDTEKCK